MCRTLHLALWNFMIFPQEHFSKPVSVSLDGTHPSGVSTAPHSLVSPSNLLRVHSTAPFMSSIKMLNSASPNTNPWGMLLVTGLPLDIKPLTTSLWVWPSSQFLIHWWSIHQIPVSLFSDVFPQETFKWRTLSSAPLQGGSHWLRQHFSPCMLQGGRCTCSLSPGACIALHHLPKQLPDKHRGSDHFWSGPSDSCVVQFLVGK